MDLEFMIEILPKFQTPLLFTLKVMAFAILLSILFSIPVSVVRINRTPVLCHIFDLWLSFIRSIPGLLELFIAYFVLPNVFESIGIDTSGWKNEVYVYIALVFHYAPYLSEIFRPAYLSVDKGQYEAGAVVGMSSFNVAVRITIPQVLVVALPQLCSVFIDTLKDTSLLFTIGVIDLMGRAETIISDYYGMHKIETYITVALLYLLITFVISRLFAAFEKHFERMQLSNGLKR